VKARGFTLLEVLVAVAILGLGMTVVLSSQVGLFTSAQRAQNLSVATNLGRCKMSEIELQLQKEGYPSSDLNEDGTCCEEEESKDYQCSWKIEKVELPQPASIGGGDGGLDDPGGLGAMGVLAGAGAGLGGGSEGMGDGGLGALASALTGGAAMGGTQGMAPIVMSMVYPDLKPMLEASIRKVTVKIEWREGKNKKDLEFTQYLTNPQQGGLDPNAAKDLEALPSVNE
jgi:general secretion pathway protein I